MSTTTQISSTMDMCNGLMMRQTAKGPQLSIAAVAACPQAIDGVPYRLIWTGDNAAAFYAAHGHQLRIGARLQVTAIDPRPLIDAGQPCIICTVLDIQIMPRGVRTCWARTAPLIAAQPAQHKASDLVDQGEGVTS